MSRKRRDWGRKRNVRSLVDVEAVFEAAGRICCNDRWTRKRLGIRGRRAYRRWSRYGRQKYMRGLRVWMQELHRVPPPPTYKSQAARDAQAGAYGDKANWDYLEESALSKAAYFRARGDEQKAQLMLTRSLSEALAGNDGI